MFAICMLIQISSLKYFSNDKSVQTRRILYRKLSLYFETAILRDLSQICVIQSFTHKQHSYLKFKIKFKFRPDNPLSILMSGDDPLNLVGKIENRLRF